MTSGAKNNEFGILIFKVVHAESNFFCVYALKLNLR